MKAKVLISSGLAGLAVGLALALAIGLTGCGNSSPQPPLPLSISVSPNAATVDQGGTKNFTASVTGTTNTAVSWSVQEGSTGGTISSAGVYSAPQAAGTFHVIATSKADSTKSAVAAVTVPSVSVTVSPSAAMIDQGASDSFSATVSGTVINTSVTWSVQEGASGGTITSAGVYTAPQAAGAFHLMATSQADPTKSAVVPISVPQVSVSVSPMSDTLGPVGVRTFVATVSGTVVNTSVTWGIEESAAGGSITNSGTYTAPTTTGVFHVVATSVASPSATAVAVVTIVSSGFTPAGSMAAPRTDHTATPLSDGEIVVVGGKKFDDPNAITNCSDTGLNTTVEVFDPATGVFETDGNQSISDPVGQTATLLLDGSALIGGGGGTLFIDGDGFCEDFVTATTELFQPTGGTFPITQVTGSMTAEREYFTATLLQNGKVLMTGGNSGGPIINPISPLASAELYDPATGAFAATGNMTLFREGHTATLLPSGKVLIAGGQFSSGGVSIEGTTAGAELYDPSTGAFAPTGSMATPRDTFTATMLSNGKVLVVGGGDGSGQAVATAELYDPVTGVFTRTGSMTTARSGHTATLLPNGNVLVVGGGDGSDSLATAELYDPASGTFSLTGGLTMPRSGHTATLLQDGSVLVIGGRNCTSSGCTILASAEIYK